MLNALGAVLWACLVAGIGWVFGHAAELALDQIRRLEMWLLLGLVSAALSHGISGVQAVHYDKGEHLEAKSAALETWILYLNAIRAGVMSPAWGRNIVPIRKNVT